MRSSGIIHYSLNPVGGAEVLSLTLAKVLRDLGFRVTYFTVQRTDWNFVRRSLGINFLPDEDRPLFQVNIPLFNIYQMLLGQIRPIKGVDIVINTHGDIMPSARADIVYMHYPTFSLWFVDPENIKRYRSVFWRSYSTPYRKIQKFLFEKRKRRFLILTNSEFTKKAIKRSLGLDAVVVYPPVHVDEHYAPNVQNRENLVVCVSRFTPEKRLEVVIETATKVKNAKFILVGSTKFRSSVPYLKKLIRMVKERGIGNVSFIPNASFKQKLDIMVRAKIFFHSMTGEHFGIAIVEGMASGLVPVVHKSGAPWIDILQMKQGYHGFAYKSINEAVQFVSEILSNEQMRKEIASRNFEHIQRFSEHVFRKKISYIVKTVIRRKFENELK
ncbi:TPA: glycosyltransferase [Candidatus Bathyarchaeota archaeon]|nr:glycosyltransferase [Candidatus Bathyarchaeota archaeon]